jgi:hypothetical protein
MLKFTQNEKFNSKIASYYPIPFVFRLDNNGCCRLCFKYFWSKY